MTLPHAILYLAGLLIGVSIGSFLGCAIYRVPRGISLTKGRSACPSCGHTLTVAELFPIFSYVFQRGRSRCCNKRMSAAYFWAELACGLVGLAAVFGMLQFGIIISLY